ncbi:hypothetical protein BDZ89DRAFT_1152622 [Hymenopellis radicata]|nr:hypothetical protein BDZ89DRAFT_1152622 [Hymenopellis radicata]
MVAKTITGPAVYKLPPPPPTIHMLAYRLPSPSKSAKIRKLKTPAKSKEKRQARFSGAAPQAILQQLDRVTSQSVKAAERGFSWCLDLQDICISAVYFYPYSSLLGRFTKE